MRPSIMWGPALIKKTIKLDGSARIRVQTILPVSESPNLFLIFWKNIELYIHWTQSCVISKTSSLAILVCDRCLNNYFFYLNGKCDATQVTLRLFVLFTQLSTLIMLVFLLLSLLGDYSIRSMERMMTLYYNF